MDLQARKYNFMEQLFEIEKESILEALELTLKKEREASLKISTADKKVLDQRLESYKNNPDDLLDWKDVENEW
ncbi:addiction module protein [Aquimarina agarilytica]|uniref:addiction module protein n=1 Tax=Aquimarina agarilytica TaxID=1087449 RepID=UPI000287E2CE|nr:addiction module protein [Aquimarina agarilytica]